MASKNTQIASNTNTKTDTTKVIKSKIIKKPLNPIDFSATNVDYSKISINPEFGTKWINTNYIQGSTKDKFLVVARGCKIITFKEKLPFGSKDGKVAPRKPGKPIQYDMFISLKDVKFIEMVSNYEDSLIHKGVENSNEWFNSDMNEEECRMIFKKLLTQNKFGYAVGGTLSRDFTWKSKIDTVSNDSDITEAFVKHTIIDVCFSFNTVKLGASEYKIGHEINQINIVGIADASEFQSKSIIPADYVPNKITLTEKESYEKGGKFCRFLYNNAPYRIKLTDVSGRLFSLVDKEGKTSFSLCIEMTDDTTMNMLKNVYDSINKLLEVESKTYFDGKKMNSKTIKLKPVFNYSPADQEKIKKGEKPQYSQSMWVKVFHNDLKQFDGKIVNVADNKPIQDIDSILNKKLHIASVEIYSRHIWFDKNKGTTINMTMNKCSIGCDVPSYDMDPIEDTDSAEEAEAEVEVEAEDDEVANDSDEEALNSDEE